MWLLIFHLMAVCQPTGARLIKSFNNNQLIDLASLKVKLLAVDADTLVVQAIREILSTDVVLVSKTEECDARENGVFDLILYISPTLDLRLDGNCLPKRFYLKTMVITLDSVGLLGGKPFLMPLTGPNFMAAYEEMLHRAAGFRFQPVAVSMSADMTTALQARWSSRVVIGDMLYMIGGLVGTSREVRRYIDVYNLSASNFELHSIRIPQRFPVFAQGVAGDGVRFIYVAGGQLDSSLDSTSNVTFRFDTASEQFLQLPSLPVALRGGSLVFSWLYQTLHFTGGIEAAPNIEDSSTPHFFLDVTGQPFNVDVWDPEKENWVWGEKKGTVIPGPRRMGHLSIILNDAFGAHAMYIIGGSTLAKDGSEIFLKTALKFVPRSGIKSDVVPAHWEECVNLPINLAYFSASVIPVAVNTGILIFGGESTLRNVVFYIPHLKYSRTFAYLPIPFRDVGHSVVAFRPSRSKNSIFLISTGSQGLGETHNYIAQISTRLFYSDFLIDSIGNPTADADLANSLNLGVGETPVYMVLHTGGGITNLKMNFMAAAEQAFRNKFIFVLPDMATDWLVSHQGKPGLAVGRCGEDAVECASFDDVFDADNFISEAKKLGLTVVRNTMPQNSIIRYPLPVIKEMSQNKVYSRLIHENVTSALAVLSIADPNCCHSFFGHCSLKTAARMTASFVLSGVGNFWQIKFKTAAEKLRRRKLLAAMTPSDSIRSEIDKVFQKMKFLYNTTTYDAIHLRIESDMDVHCSLKKNRHIVGCFVPKEEVVRRLGTYVPDGALLYVAVGTSPERDSAMALLREKYIVVTKEDLHPAIHDSLRGQRELLALVDQELCLRSRTFIGSRPSSFSFLIAVQRTAAGRPWAYYNDNTTLKTPNQLPPHSIDFARVWGKRI